MTVADRRDNTIGESTLTIKWWAALAVIISIFGWFFVMIVNHERRLTTSETQYCYIVKSLDELRSVTREIRVDQMRIVEKNTSR